MSARTNLKIRSVIAVLILVTAAPTFAGQTIYVDDDAAGANDGSSWADAFNYLQDALATAYSGDEIRVAQGIYTPDSNSTDPNGSGDREATFQLINGVNLKGGYAGVGESDPNDRDIELYETSLSGDLEDNDVELENLDWNTIYLFVGHPSRAENSCHVVTGSGTDATAVLDGVTITRGNAYGPEPGYCNNNDKSLTYGAGMYNDSGSPTVNNCTFYGNTSWTIYAYSCPEDTFDTGVLDFDVSFDLMDIFMPETSGAGIYNCNSSMTLRNCKFEENMAFGADSASAGGGIHNINSDIVLINCIFKTNVATGFDNEYWGGAIANSNSNPTLEGCSFIENLAYYGSGGAMSNYDNSDPVLMGCSFQGNKAIRGGAISGGNSKLTDCTFRENTASGFGGGINGGGNSTLTNCIFIRNSAGQRGGGMCNYYNSSPMLRNCTFSENTAKYEGGGMYNKGSNPMLTNCTFSGNYTFFQKESGMGGAGMSNHSGSPMLTNCTFSGNLCSSIGGGMFNYGSSPTLSNCTFATNVAIHGNALACDSWMQGSQSNIEVTNCIFWDGGDEIWNNDGSTITITYSDIQGSCPGEGNIDADPWFVDLGYWDANGTPDDANDDVWVDGNYHLLLGSPCIDTGDPNYIAGPNETDLDGRPRVIGGRIDMGVYELPIFAEARILPRTINLASKGKLVTCHIWLPDDYDVADIDPNSVFLEGQIKAEPFSVNEQQQVVIAKFSREDVQPILEVGEIELTITGRLTDGTVFEGADIIKVTDNAGSKSVK
ncbi:MAG: right-handed parallel beta-helix repeat-containing protein [Sedimentisphaerales bacterium]